MRPAVAVLALAAALFASTAHAAATFEYLFDDGFPIAVSSDGKVVVGNSTDGTYTSFRWTQATGMVSLGRPQKVGGGGIPGVSADDILDAHAVAWSAARVARDSAVCLPSRPAPRDARGLPMAIWY